MGYTEADIYGHGNDDWPDIDDMIAEGQIMDEEDEKA